MSNKNYIVRGYQSWAFADNREDAIVRFLQLVSSSAEIDLSRVVICNTSDDWSISNMDGSLEATELEVLDPPNQEDIEEALYTLVNRAQTLALVAGNSTLRRKLEALEDSCYS
tara:strand:- start:17786 stop:18124 length:339 start_codon:yes stop_codon:yes gene_type:complete